MNSLGQVPVAMKKKLWFSQMAAWSLMALPSYAQEPSKQDPALDPASAPEVIVQPAEELPIPEDPGRPSAARSKPPIVITPRKISPNPSPAPAPTRAPKPSPEVFGDSLLGDGEITQGAPGGGYLGLVVEPVQGGGFGLSVVDVTNQSPAWKAGFRVGDRIVGVGGQAVSTLDQLGEQLDRYPVGAPVKFLVQRRGRSTNLTAVLQDRTLAGQLQGFQPATALPLEPPKTPYQPILPSISNPNARLPNSKLPSLDPSAQSNGVTLGVSVSDLSETFRKQFGIPLYRGAAVSNVSPGTTAELAGLKPGDCISEINGRMILRAQDVVESIQQIALGDSLTIGYYRGQQKQLVEVPLLTEGMIAGEPTETLGPTLKPEQLTPEYVESLHEQIRKLQGQLDRLQTRLSQLEGPGR
ncbi:MAG: PDZ domain-containing protein [Pirellula sp.]|nr:PDZ domain-containing protein [Pirellula sp.]